MASLLESDTNLEKKKCVHKKTSRRKGKGKSRVDLLARPSVRRLHNLWDEKAHLLQPKHGNHVKSMLEEEHFVNPENTNEYFKKNAARLRERHSLTSQAHPEHGEWLQRFSSQVARQISSWMMELKEEQQDIQERYTVDKIAGKVLKKVADILDKKKPRRSDRRRLSRFMLAVADRIAVWIDGAINKPNTCSESSSN